LQGKAEKQWATGKEGGIGRRALCVTTLGTTNEKREPYVIKDISRARRNGFHKGKKIPV